MLANRLVVPMATAALACRVAGAQNMKPGLLEMTRAMQGQAGGKDVAAAQAQAQRELAALPPEQRNMVETMTMRSTSRWVGADRGNLKPMTTGK